jgi:hypothetical protein
MNQIQITQERLADAVKDLFHWQYNDGTYTFNTLLFMMFQKADLVNRARLKLGFPAHYWAWELWQKSSSQNEFFKEWGLTPKERETNGLSR